MAFANAWESLCGFEASGTLQAERALALELERMAIHTGDLSAISTDIAYQLGSSVFGRLRTPLINFFQEWCGNRFAKSLIRPGMTRFSFTSDLVARWKKVMEGYLPHFIEMGDKFFDLPSVLSRLERTGIVRTETSLEIGAVGMAARSSGIARDIRNTHPYGFYEGIRFQPVILSSGDVYARARLRFDEVKESAGLISQILESLHPAASPEKELKNPAPGSIVVSLTEGWRGEICHCVVTGETGELVHYKIKDPSLHNWLALALAVRKNEISDFPVCNKSFNLSYCGHDL